MLILAYSNNLVPKGGLEPPHPCEYMDLNHARLPIPPLRQCFVISGENLADTAATSSLPNCRPQVKPASILIQPPVTVLSQATSARFPVIRFACRSTSGR